MSATCHICSMLLLYLCKWYGVWLGFCVQNHNLLRHWQWLSQVECPSVTQPLWCVVQSDGLQPSVRHLVVWGYCCGFLLCRDTMPHPGINPHYAGPKLFRHISSVPLMLMPWLLILSQVISNCDIDCNISTVLSSIMEYLNYLLNSISVWNNATCLCFFKSTQYLKTRLLSHHTGMILACTLYGIR